MHEAAPGAHRHRQLSCHGRIKMRTNKKKKKKKKKVEQSNANVPEQQIL
jgi:hypothetical protein